MPDRSIQRDGLVRGSGKCLLSPTPRACTFVLLGSGRLAIAWNAEGSRDGHLYRKDLGRTSKVHEWQYNLLSGMNRKALIFQRTRKARGHLMGIRQSWNAACRKRQSDDMKVGEPLEGGARGFKRK
jgi:hypothetical protein